MVSDTNPVAAGPSISALNVARCRAIAAHETREDIKGRDYLAEVFIGVEGRQSLQNPALIPIFLQKMAEVSPGGYEFFVARTAYLDALMEQALRDNIPQIVNLGAGYDTRAYRFADLIQNTRLFDLDMPATIQHRRTLLDQEGVASPEPLVHVPVDFTRESLAGVLQAAGYQCDQQTLFIWEGVTYYLPLKTIDATLRFVREQSGAGTHIVFDYMLPEADCAGRYGAAQSRAAMQTMYTTEPLRFDLDPAQVEAFLNERGFAVLEHLDTQAMQARYLTLNDGTVAGQVLDLFGIVHAAACEA